MLGFWKHKGYITNIACKYNQNFGVGQKWRGWAGTPRTIYSHSVLVNFLTKYEPVRPKRRPADPITCSGGMLNLDPFTLKHPAFRCNHYLVFIMLGTFAPRCIHNATFRFSYYFDVLLEHPVSIVTNTMST